MRHGRVDGIERRTGRYCRRRQTGSHFLSGVAGSVDFAADGTQGKAWVGSLESAGECGGRTAIEHTRSQHDQVIEGRLPHVIEIAGCEREEGRLVQEYERKRGYPSILKQTPQALPDAGQTEHARQCECENAPEDGKARLPLEDPKRDSVDYPGEARDDERGERDGFHDADSALNDGEQRVAVRVVLSGGERAGAADEHLVVYLGRHRAGEAVVSRYAVEPGAVCSAIGEAHGFRPGVFEEVERPCEPACGEGAADVRELHGRMSVEVRLAVHLRDHVKHRPVFHVVPEGLVDLWTLQPRHFVLKPRVMLMDLRAAEAANELFATAEADGLPDFMILSAYRDAESQAALLAKSPEGYAALPGASEHQTGLCMDVGRFARGFSLDARHAEWLAENCWDAGFVIRYPEGSESITGVMHEPWHLRYVGREVALQIRENGWTLEKWHAARNETRPD